MVTKRILTFAQLAELLRYLDDLKEKGIISETYLEKEKVTILKNL